MHEHKYDTNHNETFFKRWCRVLPLPLRSREEFDKKSEALKDDTSPKGEQERERLRKQEFLIRYHEEVALIPTNVHFERQCFRLIFQTKNLQNLKRVHSEVTKFGKLFSTWAQDYESANPGYSILLGTGGGPGMMEVSHT